MDSICRICGKRWDSDGCSVTPISGVIEEVEYFICLDCEAEMSKKDE